MPFMNQISKQRGYWGIDIGSETLAIAAFLHSLNKEGELRNDLS